jgi:glycosyltransferase involved in cell wall biosynthesis
MAKELDHALRQWDKEPSFLYLSASREDRLFPRNLLRTGRLWGATEKTNRNLTGMAVGHVAAHFPSLVYMWWPYPVVRRYVKRFRAHVVLGSALAGHTVARLKQPFWCWLTTLYEDELLAKAEMGDLAARKVLKSGVIGAYRRQERFALERASLVAAISSYTAERVAAVYPGVADKVTVIPVPVDTRVFHPEQTQPSTPAADGRKRVVWVGRPEDPRKNVQLLLNAFQQIRDKVPEARLVMVGSGVDRLSAELEQRGMNAEVELLPSVKSTEQLAEIYRQSHVFVLSSRQEGLGIVVHEAMASGLPVVSTRCGGPEQAVREGETGYLVARDSLSEMVARVVGLLKDDATRNKMSQCARQRAAREWSRAAVAPLFLQAFRRTTQGFMPPMTSADQDEALLVLGRDGRS